MTRAITNINRYVHLRYGTVTVYEVVTYDDGEEQTIQDSVDVEKRGVDQHTRVRPLDGHVFRVRGDDGYLTHDLLEHPDERDADDTWNPLLRYYSDQHPNLPAGTIKKSRQGGYWQIDRMLAGGAYNDDAPVYVIRVNSTLKRRDDADDYRSITADRAIKLLPEYAYTTDETFDWRD